MLKFSLNHFIFFMLMGLALLLSGCQSQQYDYKGTAFDPPQPLPDFELADVSGQPFRLSQVKGDIALVFFGYTHCPDACPLTMYEVKQTLAGLKQGKERVRVIFISVDPERDTPEVLGKYVAGFGPEFIGLTDEMNKVQTVMKPFGVMAEKDAGDDSAGGYIVAHSTRLFLVDPQGQLALTYGFGFKADDLRSDLEYLLQRTPAS
ncbi:MAG: SCO family protein [Anaerolineae bacterium]